MATILSAREQTETGALARRVGGYPNMLRLKAELKALEIADSAVALRVIPARDSCA
ncbi:hypothetical protein [Sphingomonas sp. MA1305]|jgi:hypothetical protein|uniref:hypothetical protein n=1 Tax=Sphingomonas sp. MA1305 TaxID=2479204 RepID=UPI0018DF1BCD|nr:hypothetical protein [Sphingomonas sp. MA1305]